MRIAKVWKNDYPWDVRVEKICKTLIDDDHEVHLICSNVKKQKMEENINGLNIHRLPAVRSDIVNKLCSMPIFFNPLWIYKLREIVKRENIEAIMIRDLPLVLTGILIGKIYKIPVIFDMAENYPAMWNDIVSRRGIKFYNYFLKNPCVAEIMEGYVIKRVDHTIVVVEESRDRILKKGAPINRLSIVGNTPELSQAQISEDQIDIGLNDRFKIVYTGFVDSGRGLDTVIKSLAILNNKIWNICLIIVGDGSFLQQLKLLAKDLGVERLIKFTGWVEHEVVKEYIRDSDICVIPHKLSNQMNSTIPNKLFDYMLYKKPVIVSDAVPLKRIIEENDCGVVFKSGSEIDFVQKVLELKDPVVRSRKGENGYIAIKSKYNWDNDAHKLKEIFRRYSKNN
jgi:glycosyltransferase involved in cell wall biosynthesis